jgi:sulfatase maturation enzyme AslB (radical SAM superfamily)
MIKESITMSLIVDNKKLANDILERNYYSSFRNKGPKKLEIFLMGACKANCEYCYLKKHQKYLYPAKLHDYDTIVNNF